MNFVIPQPEQVSIQEPSIQQAILPDVPQYLDRSYFNIDTRIDVPAFELDNVLTTFYTVITKGIIAERLEDIKRVFEEVFANLSAEYEYELGKLSRAYSRKISDGLHTFGFSQKGLISGLMVRYVNDLHTDELLERQELVLKLKRRIVSEVMEKVNQVLRAVDKVNDLYVDIFEKDFVITEKAFNELLGYLVDGYNAYVKEVRALLEQDALNLRLFEEKLKVMVRLYEAIKERYVFEEISQDIRQAVNQFLMEEQEYLAELERYRYLGYEVLQLHNQVYSAELRKFATEVEYINKLASYVRERVNAYFTKLEVAEAKQRMKGVLLDVANADISLRKVKLGVEAEKIESLFSLYKAQLALENNILEKQRLEKVEKFKLLIEKEYLNKVSQWYDLLRAYLRAREETLHYLDTQYMLRNYLYSIRSNVETAISTQSSIVQSAVSGASRWSGIVFPAVADWYRTCAITTAQITASFIRSYM